MVYKAAGLGALRGLSCHFLFQKLTFAFLEKITVFHFKGYFSFNESYPLCLFKSTFLEKSSFRFQEQIRFPSFNKGSRQNLKGKFTSPKIPYFFRLKAFCTSKRFFPFERLLSFLKLFSSVTIIYHNFSLHARWYFVQILQYLSVHFAKYR